MKVLMIAPEPFLEPRGTPISVYQRVQGLAALGHSVDLVTYHVGDDVEIPGVTVHRIPRVPFLREVKVGPSWYKPLLDLLLLFRAFGLLVRKEYDVIHSHEEAAYFSVVLARLFRKRHLYDMHSSLPRQLANFKFANIRPVVRLFEMMERITIRRCDAVITIGEDLEAHVRKIKPGVKQMTIENLPLEGASTPARVRALQESLKLHDKSVIVYTGTFEAYQGLDILIDAARRVIAEHPKATFVLVGGKPQQVTNRREEIRKRGLGAHFRLTGSVAVSAVSDYMHLADILVSPRTEGTSAPLKIYTYMQSGKPIVATNLAAHTIVLDGNMALLVEPTADALAKGVSKLIADPALGHRLAECAGEYAGRNFQKSRYLAKLEEIYGSLIVEDPSRRPTAAFSRLSPTEERVETT